VSAIKDEKALQALAAVAGLAGFTLKSVATTDDFEQRVLTVKFTRVSDGHVQEAFDWEREPVLAVTTDANGHVEKVETPAQPGDLAETEEQANAEIAAAGSITEGEGPTTTMGGPLAVVPDEGPQRDKDTPLVGELAAAAKRRR
jgi:hypothetical protein